MLSVIPGVVAAALLSAATAGSTPVRFRVVDAAGAPVPGASVSTSIWGDKSFWDLNLTVTTGPDGVAALRRPAKADRLRVWVSADGYAGLFRGWETADDGVPPPAAFTFTLSKATTIGGRVVDAAGRGLAGVRIEARCDAKAAAPLPDGVRFNSLLAYQSDSPTTDAAGRWSLANVPAPAKGFSLRVTHPDYVSDVEYGRLQAANRVTDAQLRAGDAVIKLEPGARVSGTVTDPAGKPVAKALIVFHDRPYFTPGCQEAVTDAAGRYTLPTLPPGPHPLTVVAKGLSPARRKLTLAAGPSTQDFRLEPGRRLRVKVVDAAGKPVKAGFVVDSWRGSEGLYNHRHPDVLPSGIPNVANAAGVYEWAGAPADAVRFTVLAKDLLQQELDLTATDAVQTITLGPIPVVTGRVTDAKTGRSVDKFRVYHVLDFSPDSSVVERRGDSVAGTGGEYRTVLDRSDIDYRLLVEADGYRTAVSRPRLLADRVGVVDFPLEPAPPVRGRVLTAAGAPAAGARVSLATSIQVLDYPENGGNLTAVADAAGAFTLPAQAERYTLFAEHAAGSAWLDRGRDDPTGDITLTPWVSLAGALWQDGKTVPGQTVFVDPVRPTPGAGGPRVQATLQMRTDEAGAFAFPRVPAGPVAVWAALGPWELSPLTSSERVSLDPAPGSAVRLDLGKAGATLRGTITLEGEKPAGLDMTYSLNWLTRRTPDVAVPGLPAPAGVDLAREWPVARMREAAARDSVLTHRRFFVKPTATGEFRAVGVPAGDYWLVTEAYEKPDGCLVNPVGTAAVPATVTASQAASAATITLPPVRLPVAAPLKIGEPLPAVALIDPAGKPIDLAALKGRYVLLHGWAGWCTACAKDYAAVRALRAAVPADKLAVVGLNLDPDARTAAALAAKYGFPWPHAAVGTPAGAAAADRLRVGAVPLYFVVGPDGALLYRGADWAAAERLVRGKPGG